MKLKEARKKIKEKYVLSKLEFDDGTTEELKFPLLTTGDWAFIKDTTGVDIWEILLNASSQSESMATSRMSEKDLAAYQRNVTIEMMKKIDPKTQQAILMQSLRKADSDITQEDVDYVTSFGMNQGEYMKVINFLLYGITSEQVGELIEADQKKAQSSNTDTGDAE